MQLPIHSLAVLVSQEHAGLPDRAVPDQHNLHLLRFTASCRHIRPLQATDRTLHSGASAPS